MPPEDLDALAAQLGTFRPAPVPPRLERAVAARLTRSARPAAPVRGLPSPWALAAAATVMLLLGTAAWRAGAGPAGLGDRSHSPTPSPSVAAAASDWAPAASSWNLYRAEEEGVFLDADGWPVRRVRTHAIQSVAYRERGTGRQIEIHTPREDIVHLPLPAY